MILQSSSLIPAASITGLLMLSSSLALAGGVELPVPTVTIYPGDLIGETLLVDKAFQFRPGESLPVYQGRDGLVGKVARRTLLPGKPIPLNAVREPETIAQGRAVSIVFQQGGLTIIGQGIPLQGGRTGDLIPVRNIDSGLVVKGIVQADGTLRVSGP